MAALVEQAGWAERVAVPTDRLAVLPDQMSMVQGASLPLAGLTALRALRTGGALLGRRVLITGASGGVGRFLVELAALGGATVTAVAGRDARELTELGAHDVVATTEQASGPYDLIVESVGGACLTGALRVAAPGATVVLIGSSSGDKAPINIYDFVGHEGMRIVSHLSRPPGPAGRRSGGAGGVHRRGPAASHAGAGGGLVQAADGAGRTARAPDLGQGGPHPMNLPDVKRTPRRLPARGITLGDVVERIRAIFEQEGREVPGISGALPSAYESGLKRPRPEYLHYPCLVYEAGPAQLGYMSSCVGAAMSHPFYRPWRRRRRARRPVSSATSEESGAPPDDCPLSDHARGIPLIEVRFMR
ncbi:zinc-binding dehydrogenase [Nonomuraea dietziae]|uniref:zinc-binding dehydrogenase n=1 Tax=Nonomuraea dietziae TaxID=65515 RepID=UPI003401EC2B